MVHINKAMDDIATAAQQAVRQGSSWSSYGSVSKTTTAISTIVSYVVTDELKAYLTDVQVTAELHASETGAVVYVEANGVNLYTLPIIGASVVYPYNFTTWPDLLGDGTVNVAIKVTQNTVNANSYRCMIRGFEAEV